LLGQELTTAAVDAFQAGELASAEAALLEALAMLSSALRKFEG